MRKHTRFAVVRQDSVEDSCGPAASIARILRLIDTRDPAFMSIAAVLRDMVAAGVEINESAVAIATKLGRSRAASPAVDSSNTAADSWIERALDSSIVYYIRRGGLIKIGTTVDPQRRFETLVPDEILAFEPGGREIEMHRHRQFRHLREGRSEYFRRGRDLSLHIRRMRSAHGDPDPSWRTTSTVAHKGRGFLGNERPAPTSAEVVTASDAAKILKMNRTTIYGWARRGNLQPAGEASDGRPLYFLDHIRDLKSRSRAYRDAPDA